MGLGGCALVGSEKPWFGPQDARSAPKLRQGFWVSALDDGCRVRADRPVRFWSECAILLVRDGEYLGLGYDKRWAWGPMAMLLAGRDPMIVQLPEDGEKPGYGYAAAEPVGFDAEGRVTALNLWLLTCQDQAWVTTIDEYGRPLVTEGPFRPDVVAGKEGSSIACTVESREALIALARALKPSGAEDTMAWRWIREPRPDDFAQVRP
ncbi:MAG: hypothetical protein QM608_02670 [Caulobacter sp.]